MSSKLQKVYGEKASDQPENKTVKLDLIHSYGASIDSSGRPGCFFIEHDIQKIAYPIGRFIAFKDTEKTDSPYEMDFLPLFEKIKRVDSMCISHDKTKLAVAQRLKQQKGPNVMVYNMLSNTMRVNSEPIAHYSHTETNSEAFIAMCFSQDKDSRYLACVTDTIDTQLIFLNLKKLKHYVVQPLQDTVKQIKVCPEDTHTISISGPSIFKIFKVHDSTMRSQTQDNITRLEMNQNFTDHEWIGPHHVALGTDKGSIYIIGKKDQRYVSIHEIHEAFYDPETPISCIKACKGGLIAGSSIGNFSFWGKDEEATIEEEIMKLRMISHWKPPRTGCKVISMDFTLSEDKMVVTFSKNLLAIVNSAEIFNGDCPRFPLRPDEQDRSDLRMRMLSVRFNYLYRGFHFGEVDHIDVCTQRPLIATCSNGDSFVKIWNYMDFNCELNFLSKPEMNEVDMLRPLLSIAFHPSGYYLAVGLTTVLRIMFVMDERPRIYRDIPIKGVTHLRFSNGGHYLAVAYPKQKSNNYMISIISSYTLEFVRTFQAHTGLCTDLFWTDDDKVCYSCGEDGNVCAWNANQVQEEHNIFPDSSFCSILADDDGTVLVAGAEKIDDRSDYLVREGIDPNTSPSHRISGDPITTMALLKTVLGHEAILIGTDDGEIRIFHRKFDLGSYDSIKSHIGKVRRIIVNPSGRYVFSIGSDGLVNIYQVTNIQSGAPLMRKGEEGDGPGMNPRAICMQRELADIVLVNKKDIVEYKDRLEKHKAEIESLKHKLEQKAIDVKTQLEEEERKNDERMARETEMWAKRCEELKQAKLEADSEKHNLLKANDENHLKAVEDLEALYEKKLTYENEKYLHLEQELLEERLNNEKRFKEMQAKNDDIIEKLRQEFKCSYDEAKKIYDETRKESKSLEAEYKERLAQQEEEHELEIRELNSKHKAMIDELNSRNSKLQSTKDKIKTDYENIVNQNKNIKKTIEERVLELNKMKDIQHDQQMKIEKLKKELEDLRETLSKKEKQIYDAKSKINDLQKAKHVLSFRTTEMRKSLEPKEAQIEKLKEELYKMEGEFENMIKTKREQSEDLKRKKDELGTLSKALNSQTKKTKKKEAVLNKMKMEIFNCVNLKEHKDMVRHIKKLYQDYVMEEGFKQAKHDPKGIEEMMRQIQYLESSIHQINVATDKLVKNREIQIMKRTKDNIQLISDLNDLRTKKKQLENDNKKLLTEKATLKRENQHLQNELKMNKSGPEKKEYDIDEPQPLKKQPKFKIRDGGGLLSRSNRPGSKNSLMEMKAAEKILDLVKNKPVQAQQTIIAYAKEIQELRAKLTNTDQNDEDYLEDASYASKDD